MRANAYVQIALKVDRLKPIRGNKGISDVQKWEVCVSSVKSEKQQDAMLKVYMSDEQYKTYSDLRKIGLSPTFYVKYVNAKYTVGDKNGSWKQEELKTWLDSYSLSNAQKAAIWEATNKGWKNNPYD